jgi:preprotein translocase subunit SecA
MTGTAITEAGEFWEIYKLDVVEIPTNKPVIRDDKNDLVFRTKREKYNAIIDEIERLRNQGRAVLVGTTSVETSELLSKMLKIRKIPHNVLNAKHHQREAEIVAEAGNPGQVTIATNMAGRGTDIKLHPDVKKAGGLAIIGTERHDSRRVDRQLRGRAGRQGDPGSSQFFVSFEDDLMRLFGSERMAKILDRLGMKDGEAIQHSRITKSIENAQKKVEENNFGIRKRLLEYDDVMNSQRELVYKKRRHALEGKRLRVDIVNMIYELAEYIVQKAKQADDFQEFENELIRNFSMRSPVDEQAFKSMDESQLTDMIFDKAYQYYLDKIKRSSDSIYPLIKHVFENQGHQYKRIAVPFTDGIRTIQVSTDLEEAYNTGGKKLIEDFERNVTLAIIDEAWKEHLRKMDELKTAVQTASYEQKDPLLIYKFEAYELFRAMLDKVNKEVISFLFKADLPSPDPNQIRESRQQRRKKPRYTETRTDTTAASRPQSQHIPSMEELAEKGPMAATQTRPQITTPIKREGRKIGRNEIVTVLNVQSGEEKQMKYKKALPLIKSGDWVLKE